MRVINRYGGDGGKIPVPNFRKHLRRSRTLDILNDRYSSDHLNNTFFETAKSKYIPIYSSKNKTMASMEELYNEAAYYGLQEEVMYWALKCMDEDEDLSPIDAVILGYQEWVK